MIHRKKIPPSAVCEENHKGELWVGKLCSLKLIMAQRLQASYLPPGIYGILEKGRFFFSPPGSEQCLSDFWCILVAVSFLKQVVIDQKFIFFRVSEQTSKSKEAESSPRGHFLNFAKCWSSWVQSISWISQNQEKPQNQLCGRCFPFSVGGGEHLELSWEGKQAELAPRCWGLLEGSCQTAT